MEQECKCEKLQGTLSPEATLDCNLSVPVGLSGSLSVELPDMYFEVSNEFGTTIIIG